MSTFSTARFVRLATVLAVALALLLSGVVVGAAGGPLIMGAANNAETTNTSLTTNSTGNALVVTQNGTGTALRGTANNGIAGFFLSANGSGVSGVVAANNKYGVYGGNDAPSFGGGAAIRASGQQNHGLVATTANASADALRGVNTGGGQALDLVVNPGIAPMTVNSDTKVANLNADLLDGFDSTAFTYTGAHPIEVSDNTIGLSTVRCAEGSVYKLGAEGEDWACAPDAVDGGDAETLDGLDSAELRDQVFFRVNGTYVVPAGVTAIIAEARGGGGGSSVTELGCFPGGQGAIARAWIGVGVTPGDEIAVTVGGGGLGSYDPPAGSGGASTVAHQGVIVVTAGGGAGGGFSPGAGGAPVVASPAIGLESASGIGGAAGGGPTAHYGSGGNCANGVGGYVLLQLMGG